MKEGEVLKSLEESVRKIEELKKKAPLLERGGLLAEEKRLMKLLETIKTINAIFSFGFEQLLTAVVDSALDLTRAERGFLMLMDEAGRVQFRVARDAFGKEIPEKHLRVSMSITKRVTKKGEPLYISDLTKDARFRNRSSVLELGLKSAICVPLVLKSEAEDKIIGVLYVDSRSVTEPLSETDLNLLLTLGGQAAISIENARLVEEVKRLEEEKRRRLEEENVELKRMLEDKKEMLIGECEAMKGVLSTVRRVAPTDVPVLICGETGTGKEIIARALYGFSSRKEKPFVVVNCGAIPENLLESELFGHERGAFTGAYTLQKGKFELAEGGTLFLDEVGDLPFPLQVKLLRSLEEGEIERIGGRKPIRTDVRVVAATSKNLEEEVRKGQFRQDLLYRLNVVSLNLPPLRERGADIALLADFFLHTFNKKYRKRMKGLNLEARRAIQHHDWPGNVRELEHRIERAVIMAEEGLISAQDLNLSREAERAASLRELKESVELHTVKEALSRNKGNVTRSARELGVTRKTLQNLMKRYNLKREDYIPPEGE